MIAAAIFALSVDGGVCGTAAAGERLTLGTDDQHTPSYQAGIGIASLIRVDLGPNHKIDLQVVDSSGPVDNIRLMQKGAIELAILPSVTGHAARAATGSFDGEPPAHELKAVTMLWQDVLHLAIRSDAAATGTIADLMSLKGGNVFLGRETSGTADANRLLFANLGLDIHQVFTPVPLGDDKIMTALIDGRLDAFSIAVMPSTMARHARNRGQATTLVFLDITREQMMAANGNHWLWTPYTIPATTYPGQDKAIRTIAHSNLLAVHASVPEQTVYLITKSLFHNLSYLRRINPPLGELTARQALVGLSLPLHPGALRYFKESGLVPDLNSDDRPKRPTPTHDHDDRDSPLTDIAAIQAQ